MKISTDPAMANHLLNGVLACFPMSVLLLVRRIEVVEDQRQGNGVEGLGDDGQLEKRDAGDESQHQRDEDLGNVDPVEETCSA